MESLNKTQQESLDAAKIAVYRWIIESGTDGYDAVRRLLICCAAEFSKGPISDLLNHLSWCSNVTVLNAAELSLRKFKQNHSDEVAKFVRDHNRQPEKP